MEANGWRRPGDFVCIHAARTVRGARVFRVMYRGTQDECQIIADDKPPNVGLNEQQVAAEFWIVRPSSEWTRIAADVGRELFLQLEKSYVH